MLLVNYQVSEEPRGLIYILVNRPFSYSLYWTGTSFQWRLMRGNIIKKTLM